MCEEPKYAAIVPLRGGSKRIPQKNIRQMAGRPLCYWVLRAAHRCPQIGQIVVSTDSEEIKHVVRTLDIPGITTISRPEHLASDMATTDEVLVDALPCVVPDFVITLQATSPLTTSDDLSSAVAKYESEGADSLFTGVRSRRFVWSLDGRPLNYDPANRPRSQDFPGSFVENGAFYITAADMLRETRCRLAGKITAYEMHESTFVEIDTMDDWRVVELELRRRYGP